MPWIIKNQPDGTIPIDEMEYITNIMPNEHVVPIKSISLESSMNNCNGKALRMDYIKQVKKLAKKKKITMHLDGARSWNSSLFLNIEMKEMV